MNNIYNETDEFANTILIAFFIIGVFIKFIIGSLVNIFIKKDRYVGKSNIIIWANMIIILSILSITSLKYESDSDILYPMILFIVALLWETSYTYKYYDRINNNQVPDLYYIWGNWSNMLFASTTVIIILYFSEKNKYISNTINMLYIILVFNFFILYIQQSILDNFMVDKKLD